MGGKRTWVAKANGQASGRQKKVLLHEGDQALKGGKRATEGQFTACGKLKMCGATQEQAACSFAGASGMSKPPGQLSGVLLALGRERSPLNEANLVPGAASNGLLLAAAGIHTMVGGSSSGGGEGVSGGGHLHNSHTWAAAWARVRVCVC